MKILYKLIILLFLVSNTSYADLIKPNINLEPFDVLMIQLNSLKNNNSPYKDAGIEQTWEFAHPINKASTGPLEKFKQMIYTDSYKILISHNNSKITILNGAPNKFVYKVNILSKDKKKYYYIWQIEKVKQNGKFKDCWMTTAVSEPIYLGEII
tara:strand:- start:653 stop:1114 length:462 start_codon:yes stop_codon:yes gene_type:complete